MWLRDFAYFLSSAIALFISIATASPLSQVPLTGSLLSSSSHNISAKLFSDLEELSRIVDISYCVGTTGIQKPFLCASRCTDFEAFELVTTWETGPWLSDSCGYIAVDHDTSNPRIVVAFRGTYSIANTIVDLSTIPQEYVPYPGEEDEEAGQEGLSETIQNPRRLVLRDIDPQKAQCENCTVHAGFMTSWRHTRSEILPHLEELVKLYPEHEVTLVGHSLGGTVAALAGLDLHARGWKPKITTFGEPRIGNKQLMHYIDKAFDLKESEYVGAMYRRVTHVDDPVPLLPFSEWGYEMHAGEIYISKPDLPPDISDLRLCNGDADPECIAHAEAKSLVALRDAGPRLTAEDLKDWLGKHKDWLSVPARFRVWQLFFAHRDYFWRLGLCLPHLDGRREQAL